VDLVFWRVELPISKDCKPTRVQDFKPISFSEVPFILSIIDLHSSNIVHRDLLMVRYFAFILVCLLAWLALKVNPETIVFEPYFGDRIGVLRFLRPWKVLVWSLAVWMLERWEPDWLVFHKRSRLKEFGGRVFEHLIDLLECLWSRLLDSFVELFRLFEVIINSLQLIFNDPRAFNLELCFRVSTFEDFLVVLICKPLSYQVSFSLDLADILLILRLTVLKNCVDFATELVETFQETLLLLLRVLTLHDFHCVPWEVDSGEVHHKLYAKTFVVLGALDFESALKLVDERL
jgi:hypothetical protein